MKILLSPKAHKDLKKLPKIDQIVIAKCIRSIRDHRLIQEVRLTGYQNIYRVRIGNYRIVYKKNPQKIYIILIRHRKEVYKILNQLFK